MTEKANIFCYCSVAQLCSTLCDLMDCSTDCSMDLMDCRLLVLHYLPEFAQTHVCWVSDATQHLILCYPLLLLPSIFPSIFSSELALHSRWPTYWSFSFSISPSNEYSGLIFFRVKWFDLLAVQRTLKSLIQHHNSKALILWHLTLVSIHDYWKNYSFDYLDFVSKVMSLLFNMLSRFVIAFLPRSKRLLNSWLQSPSAVILKPKKIKSITVFPIFPYLFGMKWWDQTPWS